LVVTATLFAFGTDCPLTNLEKYLRRQAGEPAYRGGFIAHYLLPMVPDGVRVVAVPVFVGVVTAVAYTGYVARRHQARTEPGARRGLRRPSPDGAGAPLIDAVETEAHVAGS
jgi:Protein of Unknown function (DUF2784)